MSNAALNHNLTLHCVIMCLPVAGLAAPQLQRKLKLFFFVFVGVKGEEDEEIASLSLLSHWQAESEKLFSFK